MPKKTATSTSAITSPRALPTLWLSRDKPLNPRASRTSCQLWKKQPSIPENAEGYYRLPNGSPVQSFCYRMFARHTGLRLKPGDCIQIRLVGEKV